MQRLKIRELSKIVLSLNSLPGLCSGKPILEHPVMSELGLSLSSYHGLDSLYLPLSATPA